MATQAEPGAEPRVPLSRERVLRAAVDIAVRQGTAGRTIVATSLIAQQLPTERLRAVTETQAVHRHVEANNAENDSVMTRRAPGS